MQRIAKADPLSLFSKYQPNAEVLRFLRLNFLNFRNDMANIDLYGARQLLIALVTHGQLTPKEARKILERVAAQTGAEIIVSF